MGDDVIKMVNDNAAKVKAEKEAEARYRIYVETVKSRIVSYIGSEAILAVLIFIE